MSAIKVPSAEGAAEQLVGLTLLDEWNVQVRIRHDDGLTGSSRSACYRAASQKGQKAFVKAFDFRRLELHGDTDLLERAVREYNYERDVHYFCVEQGVSRITQIYAAGKIVVGGEVVHFIVCEWADKCLREDQPPGDPAVRVSDRFKALRDATSALAQLHQTGIAHQDVKPSNAVCSDLGLLKLTDLGSSSCERIAAPPHDSQFLVGQPNYAPYELLYGQPLAGFQQRRLACDLFLLGNLCFTSFVGASLSCAALHCIPSQLRHNEYTGNYAEVIPHLKEAHDLLIPVFLKSKVPEPLLRDVVEIVRCLCHPDPNRRGHEKNIKFGNNQFGLERFISNFDILEKKAIIFSRGTQ